MFCIIGKECCKLYCNEKLFNLNEENNKSKSTENVEVKKETQELRPKSKVKSENYIHIPGWAVCELGLKGNELLIYAIIFGFSQEENQTFRGSLRYLMDWTNSTKATVINVLKSLTKKGLIEKKEKIINGVKFCEYCVTRFKNEDSPIKPVVKNLYQGGIKIIPNILDNNIGTNSINRISKVSKKESQLEQDKISPKKKKIIQTLLAKNKPKLKKPNQSLLALTQ